MAHRWRVDRSFTVTAKAECTPWTASQAHARGNNTLDGNRYASPPSLGPFTAIQCGNSLPFNVMH